MGKVDKEYGDDDLDGLVPPSSARSPMEVEEDDDYNEYDASFAPAPLRKNDKSRGGGGGGGRSLLFYVATVQAFVIIYRTEVFLGCALAASVAVAITTSLRAKARGVRGPLPAGVAFQCGRCWAISALSSCWASTRSSASTPITSPRLRVMPRR